MMSSKTGATVFQPMPPLTAEQYDALKGDIMVNGVLVPVTVDQHGRVLDGHNRSSIADELGIDYPRIVVEVADDDAAMDLAVTLNGARRHLNQEQKRALIEHELIRRPGDSDRAISRRVGCSPTTVGAVRSDRRALAEELTQKARDAWGMCAASMTSAYLGALRLGGNPDAMSAALKFGIEATRRGYDLVMGGGLSDDQLDNSLLKDFISYQVYVEVADAIKGIIAEVEAEGGTFPVPAQVSQDVLDELIDELRHPLERVQIGQPG